MPVKSNGPLVHYYNLTPSKVTHSGDTGIQFWYRNFIVPSLGNQAPLVQALQLNGQIDQAQVVSSTSAGLEPMVSQAVAARENRVYGPEQVVQTSQPQFSGTACAGLPRQALTQSRGQAMGSFRGWYNTGWRQRAVVAHHVLSAA